MNGCPTFESQLSFYPYGTQYHRAPTPLPDEWEGDLREISNAGYTHVQFRPQWRWHERIRGQAVFGDLDRLFDLAHENGLRVMLKPMLENAPDWVFDDLGGTRIGFHGIPIDPIAHGAFYVGGWLPCFDNPEVMAAAQDFTRQLVLRYREHPDLWFYDAWNEPRSRPLGQCQCVHSIQSYRKWLKEHFGSIEDLNASFGKAWTAYDNVKPPQSAADYVELYLWRQWAASAVAGHVRSVAKIIKEADPHGFVMAHIGCCSVIADSAWDASDDLLISATTDRYGTSMPVDLSPKTPLRHNEPNIISDWLRRVDPDYWCHEFYPNHGQWCRLPEANNLNRVIWMSIAGGAAGFTFWQYRSERVGNETNGYGMREIDGSPTERSRVADRIAAILAKHGSRLAGTHIVPAHVAQLYSKESDLISRIQEMKAPDLWLETDSIDYAYKAAIRGAHMLYGQGGEHVDWVVSGDDLQRLSLLVVTAAEIIAEDTAEWLKSYVRDGGNLLVEFPFACRDKNTWVSKARPTHGLDELLGCREGNRIIADGEVAEFANGASIAASGWKIELIPTSGEPMAHWMDGSIAGVLNRYGKGTVYSLGANLSLAFGDNWDDPALEISRKLMRQVGLAGSEITNGVWTRRRRGETHEIWFVFNVSDSTQKVDLPCRPTEVWEGTGHAIVDNALFLPSGEAWVAEFPLV